MVDIICYGFPTAADTTTYLCETPFNSSTETKLGAYPQALAPVDARTSCSSCAIIFLVASCLLVTLFVLLLKASLPDATNWHGRRLRLFLRVTLRRPTTVDGTCPGHDGDSAGPRQGDPSPPHASVQPSLAFPPVAGRRPRDIGGKRPADDESDAEDNDRRKCLRVSQKLPGGPTPRVRCPFKAHDPDNPEYEQCGTFTVYGRLREHLLNRKHKTREQCATCGKIFTDGAEWELHTSARICEPSPRALEKPSWVTKDQAERIRNLSTQGRRNGSIEEMYCAVERILFGSDSAPDRIVSGQSTGFPHIQHTAESSQDHDPQQSWETFKRTIANLLHLQDVLRDDDMLKLIGCVHSWRGNPREQAHAVESHEPEVGKAAAVDEHFGNNGMLVQDRLPTAPPAEEQVARIPEPDRYATDGSEGRLEYSLWDLSTYLGEGASNLSPPVSLDPAQAFSAGHELDKLDYDVEFVNPVQLQLEQTFSHRVHLPVLNDTSSAMHLCSTSTALPAGAAGSEASEATVQGSSWSQHPQGTNSLDDEDMPDSLDNFDFSILGYNPKVGSMQLFDGEAPEQQSGD